MLMHRAYNRALASTAPAVHAWHYINSAAGPTMARLAQKPRAIRPCGHAVARSIVVTGSVRFGVFDNLPNIDDNHAFYGVYRVAWSQEEGNHIHSGRWAVFAPKEVAPGRRGNLIDGGHIPDERGSLLGTFTDLQDALKVSYAFRKLSVEDQRMAMKHLYNSKADDYLRLGVWRASMGISTATPIEFDPKDLTHMERENLYLKKEPKVPRLKSEQPVVSSTRRSPRRKSKQAVVISTRESQSDDEGTRDDDEDARKGYFSAIWEKVMRTKWIVLGLLGKGLLSTCLKFLALSLVRIPALKGIAAVLLMVVGVLNDNALPDLSSDDPAAVEIPHKPKATGGKLAVTESKIPVPESWTHKDPHDVSCYVVDVTSTPIRAQIEAGMRATAHSQCGIATTKAKVLKVERIENMALWKQYWHRKSEMLDAHSAHGVVGKSVTPPKLGSDRYLDPDKLIDPSLNEVFLYHGTSLDIAKLVTKYGYDERVSNTAGLYGGGIYFAHQSCKANQYSRVTKYLDVDMKKWSKVWVRTILVSRVTLGDPFHVKDYRAHREKRRAPERPGGDGLLYDSEQY